MKTILSTFSRCLIIPFAMLGAAQCIGFGASNQAVPVNSGDKIAFLGDSITNFGWVHPDGYVKLVMAGLEANGIKAEAIPAGISGNTSKDMLGRLDRSVLSNHPQWMTLSCGVNDVWHGDKGVALDVYKQNISSIVDQCQKAGIKVMILTSTMIMENSNDFNKKLADYNAFLTSLAAEKHCLLADLNAAMQAEVKAGVPGQKPGNLLTVDGVHMNLWGNEMMATGVLKAFGLDDAQMDKARQSWQDIQVPLVMTAPLHQWEQLSLAAGKQNTTMQDLGSKAFSRAIEDLLKSTGEAAPGK